MSSVFKFDVASVSFGAAAPAGAGMGYAAQLRGLALVAQSLPPGWRTVYAKAMRKLAAMETPARFDLEISGPLYEAGDLAFHVSRPDRAVQGVLGKLIRQLACRCWICAKAARPRRLGLMLMPLCAECHAPRALRAEIAALLRDLQRVTNEPTPGVRPASSLSPQLRTIIPPLMWRQIRADEGDAVATFLTWDDLRDASPALAGFQAHLADLTGRGDYQ
jgi:hypothetical protein